MELKRPNFQLAGNCWSRPKIVKMSYVLIFTKYEVIEDLTQDLTKCKLHKNFMRKTKTKFNVLRGIEPITF